MENIKKTEKKSHAGYIVAIVMLLITIAALIGIYKRQYDSLKNVNAQIEAQRDTLNSQLVQMLHNYDSVKVTNEKMQSELDSEKKKIRILIRKMYNSEQINLETIRKYENEANTLRSIMRSYLRQIDSLNTLSQRLLAENKEVKQSLEEYKEENKVLSEHKQSLEQRVEKASMLKISGLTGEGLNSRDKATDNVNRITKLKGCFTLNENMIAVKGMRAIYIRLLNPSKTLMENSESGTLETQNGTLQYSARREVDYQGEALETCVYFALPADFKLPKGMYEIQVYIDGVMVGNVEFVLKGLLF